MALEKFHFATTDGDTKIAFPYMEDVVSARWARDNATRLNEEGVWPALEHVAAMNDTNAKAYEKILDLPLREFNRFSRAWQEGRSASLGESEA